MTIPNFLTLLRILLLPFILFFLNSGYNLTVRILFFISASTDLIDCYIARRFSQVSELGKLLDPLADKLTVITIFIALMLVKELPLWIMIVVLIREFIILGGSVIVFFEDKKVIKPSYIGKTATFFLYLTGGSYIWEIELLQFAIFIAIPLAFFSGIRYCIDSYNYFFQDTSWQG